MGIQTSLSMMIDGNYTRMDIRIVVEYFCDETVHILNSKNSLLLGLVGDWESENEVYDIALDFIAPLFSRNELGIFSEVKKYFGSIINNSDGELNEKIKRLLNSMIKQGSIIKYQERDPIGRIFYRSLRYILTKYPTWERYDSKYGVVIGIKSIATIPATELLIEEHFSFRHAKNKPMVQMMEIGLKYFLEKKQKCVPIHLLLNHIRRLMNKEADEKDSNYYFEDHTLELSLQQIRKDTVIDIDKRILESYESKGKLSSSERSAFRMAIISMLNDHSNGMNNYGYFNYLSAELPELTTPKHYQDRYRKQFEYVAKAAKQSFSATVKSDFNLR